MAKYLISCSCGRQHAVDTAQAGDSLTCQCGETVAVPTLRQLRQLPPAESEPAAPAGSAWGVRQGAITVCLLFAAACVAIAIASRVSEKQMVSVNPVARAKYVERQIAAMTPLQAWQLWVHLYQPLTITGFQTERHSNADAIQRMLLWYHWIQGIALALAGVGVVAAVVLWTRVGDHRNATAPDAAK
jgi:hypothetical protein